MGKEQEPEWGITRKDQPTQPTPSLSLFEEAGGLGWGRRWLGPFVLRSELLTRGCQAVAERKCGQKRGHILNLMSSGEASMAAPQT